MKKGHLIGRFIAAIVMFAAFALAANAASLSPILRTQLNGLANDASVGVVIVSFNTSSGLTNSHLNILRGVGITKGVTFNKLGMVGAVLTTGQVRALQSNPAVRSIWSNDPLMYYLNHARTVTGVDRLRTDAPMTFRNGGMPVTGNGDFSVLVIDSGIDATGADLPFGSKVIQNTQRVVSTVAGNTGITVGGVALNGFTPSLSIENLPNTDNVGHGTHCSGIVGGLGSRSGGTYGGVAPGAKIVGSGGGVVIVVLDALAGWEYGLSHQDQYKIRVVTNSYGPIGGGEFDPNHPFMVAAKQAHDQNMTVLFAAGNDGSAKNTLSPYAQAPWVIGVAAGSKEGMLADFSSRGTPRSERLADADPTNDNDAPTLTAPGTGRFFENSLARFGFTADIVSVRSTTGLTNALNTNDTEIPAGMLPFYTSESGTSMATPFTAGVVALMLDADPTLTPDEIKQILQDTATKMPGYDEWEVGAGYINAYAAVDKVFNRNKNYKNFSDTAFNAQFGEERPPVQNYHIDYDPSVSGAGSVNSKEFTVEPGMSVLDVYAVVDNAIGAGTGNFVGVSLYDPNGVRYGATSIPTPVVGSDVRETTVDNPVAGTWRMEVRGASGLAAAPQAGSPQQLASPGTADVAVTQVKYTLPIIPDIANHPQRAQIEFALKNRVIDTYTDGSFRPDSIVTREDLARSLVLNTPLRQSISSMPKFTDVTGDLARIAEAVTASGSTLRDYNFAPAGMMSVAGTTFNPTGSVNRLDLAVAFVRALGRDGEAKALAGTTVTSNGTPITDNASIPNALRGYVQIAINDGMFEAFPAELRQIGPGQYIAIPGPRFEPATTVNRATLAVKLTAFNQLFTTGG